MADDQYSWTTFYSEFADRLLEFKDNRQKLISCLQNVYTTIGMKFPRLDTNVVPKDIDQFTIFGLFNKGISEVNRKKIATELSSKFSVKAPIPNNFDGIPTLNNLNATFYAFYDDDRRGIHDIDNIWNVFESGIAYSDNPTNQKRTNFIKTYDKARGQFGLGWRITIGLYWIRPYSFISLDSRNRWYLEYQENAPENIIANIKELKTPPDGASYLDLRDKIFEAMKSGDFAYKTLPDLSMNAFKESEKINQQNKEREQAAQDNALGDADVETIHYWLYAPGEKASKWDDFYERGVMGLGWHELGDLRNYPSKEDMRLKLQEINGNETSQSNSAHAVWQFANYIKPGDVVFAKRGRSEILGRGKIEGDYEYRRAR